MGFLFGLSGSSDPVIGPDSRQTTDRLEHSSLPLQAEPVPAAHWRNDGLMR
jgi:hypothetical protein